MKHDEATRAVLRVGEGRGFVVEHKLKLGTERLVITAAHCLPHFTPRNAFAYTEERTYKALLGPLGADATVWAECLFVDPVDRDLEAGAGVFTGHMVNRSHAARNCALASSSVGARPVFARRRGPERLS